MKIPFRDEFNDLFRHDRAIWWKMLGGAVATALAVLVFGQGNRIKMPRDYSGAG